MSNQEYFDLLLSKLREKVRLNRGQNKEPSFWIMDSKSVKWGNNRSLNSFDGNKKVKGIKRYIIVDKNGFLLAIMVTIASIHDSKATELLMKKLYYFLCPIKVILADGSYRGEIIENVKNKFGYIIQVVMRSNNNKNTFNPIHKRWVLERTFAWFDNAENMVKIAAIKLLLKKI